MDSPSLAELTRRVNGGGGAVAGGLSVEAVLGRVMRHLDRAEQADREMQRAVQPVIFPAVRFPVSGGVLQFDPAAAMLGPEDGQVWFVERVSVAGLVAGGGTPMAKQGSVTSPGSLVSVAQITAANLIPGTYTVQWAVDLDGTVSATDVNNFQLSSALVPGTPLASENNGAAGHYQQLPVQITIPVGNAANLTIRSNAAGTAGAIYSAEMTLTPVPGDEVSLYREIGGAGGGNPENFLHTFTAAPSGPGPSLRPGGKGLVLRAPEQLLLAGSNLAASAVILSAEGIAVESRWLPRYLL